MQPITVTVGPLAASSNNAIALTQTPAAGPLILNGATVVAGVAVLDHARQVLFTTTGNETGKTFTITGTDAAGSPISEVVAAPNISSVGSALSYKTVTSITISAAAAAALVVGTDSIASSAWVRLDSWANPFVGIQINAIGTVNYTLQQTMDDPNSLTSPVAPGNVTWINSSDPLAVAASTSIQTNYGFAPTFARVLLNSGAGSVSATFVQYDVVGR